MNKNGNIICFKCNRIIKIHEKIELKYIYPNLMDDLFLIKICNLCSNKCFYKIEYLNNYMKLVDIHNNLGKISDINIFTDFDKMAKWISTRKKNDKGFEWLKNKGYIN